MPRSKRIHFPGAIYHVVTRGIERKPIFLDRADYQKMTDIVRKVRDEEGAKLICAALMPNHPHLSWRVFNTPLSRIMHRVLTSYAGYFNKRYERVGHVFQGRYKPMLCADPSYLLTHIRYVHQNPWRAGLEESVGEWPWTSHADYLGTSKRPLADAEYALSFFGSDLKTARRRYCELIGSPVTGDELQAAAMMDLEEESAPLLRIKVPEAATLDRIAEQVAGIEGLSVPLLSSGSRRRRIVSAKRRFVADAVRSGHPTRKIAEFLGCSISNVSLLLLTDSRA